MADPSHPPSTAIDSEETIELLQELVRIPSPYFEEKEIVEFVHEWLADAGLDPEYQPVSEPEITGFEGRNVLAQPEGNDPDAPTLLLNAHVDTVQLVEGWEEDPLSGRIEDGKLYGQGACDMKGGLAAIMVAFRELADDDLRGDVIFSAVVDEEGPYGLGADRMIRDRLTDGYDAAIVTEPGPILAQWEIENPALILGARGRFLYDLTVRGHAAHGSQPEKGKNAMVDAGRLAEALAAMDVDSHPKLGDGSVCPLSIEDGSQTLSVPDRCRLLVDRHVVIGEDAESVLADAERVVDGLDLACDVEVGFRETPTNDMRYGPYVTGEGHPFMESLRSATETVAGTEPAIGYFSSVGDFNYFCHRAELPTVILGPDAENIHGTVEFVYTDDVIEVAEIVVAATRSYVG